MSKPRFAAALVPTSTAVGVASPRAHGHATTNTLHASCSASSTGLPEEVAVAATAGKARAPTLAQKPNVAAERPITAYANLPETASAARCTGAVRAWARSTAATISAMAVSPPLAELSTAMTPAHDQCRCSVKQIMQSMEHCFCSVILSCTEFSLYSAKCC